MGVTAGRKARTILANTRRVLAIEWVCAAQGLELAGELAPGTGVELGRACLRERVRPLVGDRYLKPDLDAAEELLLSGAPVAAVEAELGPLEA